MQRESFGSSSSKLHEGEDSYVTEGQKCRVTVDGDDCKGAKSHRSLFLPFSPFPTLFLTSAPKPEKLIHFIPALIILCFIVLYPTSYIPSQSGSFSCSRIN
ncbi:hypothetical protein like AT2G35470 [Hibiscus trionum]|uniref:Uncharacterized protein n=1 Tax=Hibiscus trionum TaxID=183268 RepID=A0A9W7J657_HIBTR|nr:hypothetical protein like AT2G35470 [Hibiscus trionum]